MGFITNQWLKGFRERNRSYYPIRALLVIQEATDSWSSKNDVVAELKAIRQDDNSADYQSVFFNGMDLDTVLPPLIQSANSHTRKKLAFDILQGLDDADLLSFLSELLPSRPSNRV